jgi:hypothetical protein
MAEGLLGDRRGPAIVDLASFFDSEITPAVVGLMGLGCLVSLGTTRDRGAVSVTITLDGDWDREYFRASEDCVEWLCRATQLLSARNGGPVSQEAVKPQKTTRGARRAV